MNLDPFLLGNGLFAGYLLAFGAAAAACFFGAVRAGQIKHNGVRRGLRSLLLLSGVWAASQVGTLLAPAFWATAFYIAGLTCGFATVFAWLWFCSAYTGRALHRHPAVQQGALCVWAVVTLTKVTNPLHGLYFTAEVAQAPFPHLAFEHGLVYWVSIGLAYALAAVGYFMLLELFVEVRQGGGALAVLSGLTALPAALNIVGSATPWLIDVAHEPLGVAAFAVGVLVLYRGPFEAVRLVGTREDPTLVIGEDGQLRDWGEPAARLFPVLRDRGVVGTPLEEAVPELREAAANGQPTIKVSGNEIIRDEISRDEISGDGISGDGISGDGISETAGPRYYRVGARPFGTGNAHFGRILTLTDVSEQEERRRDLERYREYTARLLDAIDDLFFVLDGEAQLRRWNDSVLEVTGYSDEEVGEMSVLKLAADEDRGRVAEAIERGFSTGRAEVEASLMRKDGSRVPFEFVGNLVRYPEGELRVVGIGRDVTERKRREQALEEAKDQAQEAARLKSAMLANMSHEIRTPLTSITGFAELLKEALDGDLGVFASKIYRGSQRLQQTLDSVLDLSRLEAGAEELEREEVDLGQVAKDVVAMLRDQADEKSISVTAQTPDSPVIGYWNENAVHRVCRNLVENAIKYTPEGGEVTVRTGREEGYATVEVEDTGIGMDPDTAPELFRAFRQESQGWDREYEGTGLGLSIVKRLVEELGGTIGVETEKGEGTCFTVQLPLG